MTATLEHLRNQEQRAQSLLSVVKTMKSLAAGSIRDYERAAESLQEYASIVDLGFRILLRLRPRYFDTPGRDDSSPLSALILMGSDQGMVGRFNEEIVEFMRHHLYGDRRAMRIFAIGNRLSNNLAADGIVADATIELPGTSDGIVARVEEILVWLESTLSGLAEPQVLLAHHRPRPRGIYESTTRMLLPLDAAWLEELGTAGWPYRGIPAYSLPDPQLAKTLVRQYLLVSLQRAMAQSLAAEQAKRLAAMQAAEKNVLERIDSLNAKYRRQRQESITAELLEVTAGFYGAVPF